MHAKYKNISYSLKVIANVKVDSREILEKQSDRDLEDKNNMPPIIPSADINSNTRVSVETGSSTVCFLNGSKGFYLITVEDTQNLTTRYRKASR